jgi:hypothetical protein
MDPTYLHSLFSDDNDACLKLKRKVIYIYKANNNAIGKFF